LFTFSANRLHLSCSSFALVGHQWRQHRTEMEMQPHWRERSESATWIETESRRRTLLRPLDDICRRNREDPRPLFGKLGLTRRSARLEGPRA
jgi:hypothetical protein